ncbi:hypothetical protein PF008_g4040 [Phytophthora fragariae]|uniref:Uncharacterized protein n=1 Tax=Phytophthora fragariae TaxID=53985 RepID=A0A6G0SEE2_9STRA|nr:hypothetical protein PF008_g4040 [Phytophthora fragariae]
MDCHLHQPILSPETKFVILTCLFGEARNGTFPLGAKANAARLFSGLGPPRHRYWDLGAARHANRSHRTIVPPPLRGMRLDISDKVAAVPVPLRQTQRRLVAAVQVPRTMLQRYIKAGMHRHSFSTVKPRLSPAH